MRPVCRTWLQASCWSLAVILWFWFTYESFPFWQPGLIGLGFALLYFFTSHWGYRGYALPFVNLLAFIGWLFLFRLDPVWAGQQFKGILMGFLVYLLGLGLPLIRHKSAIYYGGAALGLLLATLLWGVRVGGAQAWMEAGPVRFQPVEFAKIFMVIFLAAFGAEKRGHKPWDWLALGLFCLFLALQRDLGPALLVFLVYSALSFCFAFSWPAFGLHLVVGLAGFLGSWALFPHLQSRILAWLRPWDYLDTKGYQILQGLFALQAGGLMGQGIGRGQVQAIPAAHTDYLFAVIGEELGLVGTTALILIYWALAFGGIQLVKNIEDKINKAVAYGLILLFQIQTFVVLGGILRFLPFTGMTLPFVSYGTNSLLAQMWMLGLLTRLGGKKNALPI